MTTRDGDGGYEVGFGRPPVHTRFRTGQSGNPRGPPKASKNIGTILEEIFFREITVTNNGVRKEFTVLEAILRRLANGALNGDIRQVDRLFKLLPMLHEGLRAAQTKSDVAQISDPQTDTAVLEALAEMLDASPDDLFATLQTEAASDDPGD